MRGSKDLREINRKSRKRSSVILRSPRRTPLDAFCSEIGGMPPQYTPRELRKDCNSRTISGNRALVPHFLNFTHPRFVTAIGNGRLETRSQGKCSQARKNL